ncbi:MAG: hypothetical protein WCL51_04990 [Bacteroidota bacterium]
MSKKLNLVILKNELPDDHLLWINACNDYDDKVTYRIIDLTKNNWLDNIRKEPFDILLTKPGGINSQFKQLYDERVFILNNVLGYKLYPSANEVYIYENKRFLSFWLEANNIPHPNTFVFYHLNEAINFLETQTFPIVAKTSIGASGSGVEILRTKELAMKYLKKTFSGKGAFQRTGPDFTKGNLIKRSINYVLNPSKIKNKINVYKLRSESTQKCFVIFQQYIPHDFEWRVVRIGDSFFAHKKLIKNQKASGSLLKEYLNPPLDLFNFVKNITDRFNFYSQAIDIFEAENGYLINEMQCIFGQSDSYQMKVDGKIGRYIYNNNKWLFEEGDFNKNESYNLRIKYLIDLSNFK